MYKETVRTFEDITNDFNKVCEEIEKHCNKKEYFNKTVPIQIRMLNLISYITGDLLIIDKNKIDYIYKMSKLVYECSENYEYLIDKGFVVEKKKAVMRGKKIKLSDEIKKKGKK